MSNWLFLSMFSRTCFSGFWMGIVFGAGYAAVIFPLPGIILGGAFGGMVGLALGLINGLLMVLLTRLCFSPIGSIRRYRYTIGIASSLVTAMGVAGLYTFLFISPAEPRSLSLLVEQEFLTLVALPTLVATLAACGATQRSLTRYIDRAAEAEFYGRD